MRRIMKTELRDLAAHGEGVVLVDRHGRGDERASTLHQVTCPWPRKTSAETPLLYEASFGAAFTWLIRHRGAEGEAWKRCRDCRASGARTMPKRRPDSKEEKVSPAAVTERAIGQPVWTTDRGRDLAWVTDVSLDALSVAAFDSARNEAFDERRIDASTASAFLPRAGDRCYVERVGSWLAATCVEDADDVDQFVSVSSDGVQWDVPLTALRFRRLAPVHDPLAELAEQRAGSMPRYHARARFLDGYWHLAEASRGLLGVSSAAVDLHPHQVGVARRVLADPVQRYLLADEVGLGKTIEAGFVIRQRLIDAPTSIVVVLAPDALVWQWESELDSKFGVRDFRRGGVEVVGFDGPRALHRILTPDLLVIDEAHRIAAGWNSPAKELRERFEAARALAHRVPRILLLSATPVLHREVDLLAMLHLLDPDTYRLEEVEAFKSRVTDRERIGELLLALRPGAPSFLLRSRLPDLREAFPKDARLVELVDEVASLLDGDAKRREAALAEARAHISETYRLHRRLLRNRRSAIEGSGYVVRGRLGIEVLLDGDHRREAVDEWLERWRLTLLEDAHEGGGEEIANAISAFLVYVWCATGDLSVLRDLAQFKLTWKRAYREAAGLAADEAAAVRAFGISERQRHVLGELLDIVGESDPEEVRTREIARTIVDLREEAVLIFTSSPATADALRDQIASTGEQVQTYTAGLSDAERRLFATAFAEGTGRRFLICDRTGEEGVNIQTANCIVHVDLPLSTTRIEQRIGRVDRHGEREPVTNYVVDPGPDGGFGGWWLQALATAFEVFDRTTAPLQYAIETVQGELLRTLAVEGINEAAAQLRSVKARVDAEQARIDKLDSLDALARQDSDDVQFVEQIRAVEAASAGQFSTTLLQALESTQDGLKTDVTAREGGGRMIRFGAVPPALRMYAGVAERQLATTANRRLAVTDPELGLLRPGSPLVEAVRTHLAWDDRCQTAAAWVHDDRYEQSLLAVRCDVVVRADPGPAFAAWKRLEAARPRSAKTTRTDADAPLAVAALQRRLDAYLSPRPVELWIDRHGAVLEDGDTITALNEYIATVEQQWDDRHWEAVARTCGALAIDDVLMPLTAVAQDVVLGDRNIRGSAQHALARAREDWKDAERALRLRAELDLDASAAARDLADERDVSDHLLAALERPIVEWSGAAVVFITSDVGPGQ